MNISWSCWRSLYIETWCVGRNLSSKTIDSYRRALEQFEDWAVRDHLILEPVKLTSGIVLEYTAYLRHKRKNGDSAINRAVIILKGFFKAMVAFGHLEPRKNPMAGFPKIKGVKKKLPVWLTSEEVKKLLEAPSTDTVLGLRDRAILVTLYATGIRASECAEVLDEWVDLENRTIRVLGKGGNERVIPLNQRAVEALKVYRQARGEVKRRDQFFRTKRGDGLKRSVVYERVRKWARVAKIDKRVTPHTLRHTCATHLVQRDVNLVTIRDILGHRQITSTQIYLHTTAHDLKKMIEDHPVSELAPRVESLLEGVRIPIDHPPRRQERGAVRVSSKTVTPGKTDAA